MFSGRLLFDSNISDSQAAILFVVNRQKLLSLRKNPIDSIISVYQPGKGSASPVKLAVKSVRAAFSEHQKLRLIRFVLEHCLKQ
jgi:hypothetical protein